MTDPNFERSLRAAARRGRPGGVHPDASLLAAYVDRGLNAAERARLEAHVADCTECMERLALLGSVNVPEEPQAPAIEWSPRQLLSRWGWLVPVATIVVLVAVWERQPAGPPPAPAASDVARTPAAAPASPQAASQPAEANEQQKSLMPSDAGGGREALSKAPSRQVAQAPKAKDAAKQAPPAKFAERRPEQPPVDGGRAEESVTLRDKKEVDSLGALQANKVGAPQAPVPAAPAAPPTVQAEAAASVARADEAKPGNRPQALTTAGAQGALLKSDIQMPVVLATGPGVSIRRFGSVLERSTDGATWNLDLADAPAGLNSGSCPTSAVCWIGGAGGVILLRHDSGRWTRHVVADGRAAVIAIEAGDATTATVRLADGRGFRTSDAGATWVELPGDKH